MNFPHCGLRILKFCYYKTSFTTSFFKISKETMRESLPFIYCGILIALSIGQIIKHRKAELLMHNKFESVWNEVLVTKFEVKSLYLRGSNEE
jgi:hypothetical protein